MRRVLFIAFLFTLPSLHAQQSSAPDPRIAQIVSDLSKTRTPQVTALSPDGKYLAWTAERQLHLVHTDALTHDTVIAPPTNGCTLSGPSWSADSHRLAYLSRCTEEKYPSIYIADPATAIGQKFTAPQGNISSLQWSPDGTAIAFLFVPNASRSAGALDAMKPAIGVIGRDNVEVQQVALVTDGEETSPSAPETSNLPLGSRSQKLLSLFRSVTPQSFYAYEFAWSPDSQKIVFTGAPPPGENNWWVAKLYIQPLSGGTGCALDSKTACSHNGALQPTPTLLVDPTTIPGPLHGLQVALPHFSPDGHNVAFIGGLMSDFGSNGGDLYIVKADGPYAGKDTHPFTAGRKTSIAWFQWTDPDHVLITEHERGRVHVAILGTSGAQMPWLSQSFDNLGSGTSSLSLSVSLQTKSVAMVRSSFEHAPEVWYGAPDKSHQVSHLNDGLKPSWGKSESIEYKSDEFDVQGFLLYPAHYDPAKKYGLITFVHGGPAGASRSAWPGSGFGAAPFSAMDYFVFLPNPRGSYGQGEAFTQANRKDFGYGDLRDILAGVDLLEKRFPIDPDRVGVTGWSYGGFMTMFSITQTGRFKAAVAGAGISNWQSYYGQNSIDQWMTPYFGASVYDDPAVYAKSSAINFIKQVKTPTLIVVGDRDGECPAPQSFEFWHALRAQDVETELVVYPNEGHGFRDPAHRIDVLTRALEWFNRQMPAK